MSQDRISDPNMSLTSAMFALSEGNAGALNVLMQLMQDNPMQIFICDSKRLYGSRIWMLYKDICGEDIGRFAYHLCVELPNQETGKLSITGPYAARWGFDTPEKKQFWASRRFGKPGSFWALEHPPTRRDYAYPLGSDGAEILILDAQLSQAPELALPADAVA